MPNQVVFQILITLLEVHYLCERAQTIIKAAMGKGMWELTTVVTGGGHGFTSFIQDIHVQDEAAYVQNTCVIILWEICNTEKMK